MRHVAAYLLCVLGGNDSPSVEDVSAVITSVGAEVDADKLALLVKELEGKNVTEIIDAGKEKLSSVSIGGGGAAGAGAAGASADAGASSAAAKEEEEEEEEADLGGGMDMFGGGDDY